MGPERAADLDGGRREEQDSFYYFWSQRAGLCDHTGLTLGPEGRPSEGVRAHFWLRPEAGWLSPQFPLELLERGRALWRSPRASGKSDLCSLDVRVRNSISWEKGESRNTQVSGFPMAPQGPRFSQMSLRSKGWEDLEKKHGLTFALIHI